MLLTITVKDDSGSWVERYPTDDLIHPDDVGYRRTHDPVEVTTQEEAEEYGKSLIAAFNRTRRDWEAERTFVSAALEEEDDE